MKHLYIFLFLFLLFIPRVPVVGQEVPERMGRESIHFGHIDHLYSDILQEDRKIWVHLPSNYFSSTDRGNRYPVLFVLDAKAHFKAMAAMADQLGEEIFWPRMIVIGIENTNRLRDLTPTKIHQLDDLPEAYLKNTGGASKFLEFITKELIPFVDANYPTTPYRSLIGHSLGGLFTTYAMYAEGDSFRNYIAIDPSYWWDNNYLLKQLAPYRHCPIETDNNFYLAAANTLPPETTPQTIRNDRNNRTAHFRAIAAFADIMERNSCAATHFHYRYYPEQSHANVSLTAFYDAFTRIFDFYNIDPVLKQFDPERLHNISTKRFLNAFNQHYRRISQKLGYLVLPEEDLISSMGYKSMELEDFEKAEALFRMNITNFPESSRAYNSLGDFYMITDRPRRALKIYEKALELEPDVTTVKKVQALKNRP